MIRSLIRKKFPASRLAMSIGLSSTLLALNFASAQTATNAENQPPADRIVITGSNIPSSEEVGTAPVDVVDQAARDRTGQEDVLTVLTASTPAISSGGGNLGQSNASIASGGTLGGSTVSVHGLQTLVLLNGRRVTDSSAAAAGGGTFTDLNLFPSNLVKRVEVLKDGASAIYGTEAIGGVVNVILDSEFQGFKFEARYGETERADVQDQRYSAIFGVGDAKTHVVVGAEYVEQQPIFNRERDFSKPSNATTTFAGIARFYTTQSTGANGNVYYRLAPGLNSPNDVVAPGSIVLPTTTTPGNPIPGVYIPNGTTVGNSSAATTQQFDLARATSITLDQTRLSVFASADRELFDKYVVGFADFLYSSNYSQSYLNAQPLSNATGVVIPAGSPYNPFTTTIGLTTNVAAGVTGLNRVQVNNRFITNPRIFRQDADFYRIVAGLKGEIIKNYNYEVAMNTSREELSFRNFNLIRGDNLNAAIAGGFDAAGNPLAGGKFSTLPDGTVQPALDFFSRTPAAGSLNGVFATDQRYYVTKFYGLDGKITAFPYTLPAGPIGVAAGGEWRHETLKANLSPEIFLGSVPGGDIDVGRDVTAGFGEIQIPVIGPDMHIPGVYSFDVDAAVRYENYSDAGDTIVPKVGIVYRPIKDIALRGTYSESFIAPTLFQTSGPSITGFSSSIDLGAGSEQSQETGGSSKNLQITEAQTFTAGIVISPRQVPGLTLNCDYFHVEEQGLVGTIDDTLILSSVDQFGPASPFASFVHVGSFGGPGVTAPGQLAGNLPAIYVVDNLTNLGGLRIGGVDFGAHYNHDFGKFGAINVGIDGTYYFQYKQQSFNFTPFYNVIGYYQGQAAEVADYHLTPSLEYKWQGFTASALGNYTPSVRDAHNVSLDPSQGGIDQNKSRYGLNKIRDYYTIDLLFSYEFGLNKPTDEPAPAPMSKDAKDGGKQVVSHQEAKKMMGFHLLDGLKLSFGINNVTNARPPLIIGSPDSTNTDASIYDPYQRRYYFVVTKKF